jgi:hypothetical protein
MLLSRERCSFCHMKIHTSSDKAAPIESSAELYTSHIVTTQKLAVEWQCKIWLQFEIIRTVQNCLEYQMKTNSMGCSNSEGTTSWCQHATWDGTVA